MSEEVLKTINLSKKYKNTYACNNVNINIKKGDIYGLIGQNGAGKTTLFRLITGLIGKTKGDIELFGKNGIKNLDEKRVLIGSLIESPAVYGSMTARENLEVSRLVRNIVGKECIEEVLELVGLKNTGNKKAKNFSLGMRQRLGLANALLGNPEFLILDEPINGLDPMSIVEIREILKNINKEKQVTILISSHILGELSELATTYGILNDGKLIEEFSEKELKEKCRQYIEINLNDTKKAVTILEQELNISEYEVFPNNTIKVYSHLDSAGKINSILSASGLQVEKILLKGQNLEEYFISAIGGEKNA
ncbi:ATP-binding cassette domain-containing protein [Clostridium sp. DL1XJH146]